MSPLSIFLIAAHLQTTFSARRETVAPGAKVWARLGTMKRSYGQATRPGADRGSTVKGQHFCVKCAETNRHAKKQTFTVTTRFYVMKLMKVINLKRQGKTCVFGARQKHDVLPNR
jgi:hypothetical protein